MHLKIRIGTISKFVIEILVLMHLCYFLIAFSNTSLFADSFIPKPRMMIFFFMIGISIIVSTRYIKKNSMKFLLLEMFVLAVTWINGYSSAASTGHAWADSLALLRVYVYPILAIAIIPLLTSEIWNLERLLKFIAVTTSIDTIVRGADSLMEYLTGAFPWPNLIYGEMGYRNGIYRIQPSNLDILIIPIAFYLFHKAKTSREKKWCVICIAINYLYALVIWQARSAIIYKTILLIVLFFSYKRMDRKKIIWITIGFVAAIVATNLPAFNSFVDSFSILNDDTGGSTLARLNAITFYMSYYAKTPIWGLGMLDTEQRIAVGGGTLGDIGFLYSIVQLGVPIILFYIVMFSRGIYVAIKCSRYDLSKSRLIMGITLSFILFGFNIDTFYGFALAVPFYLAIVEYGAWEQKYDVSD